MRIIQRSVAFLFVYMNITNETAETKFGQCYDAMTQSIFTSVIDLRYYNNEYRIV